MAAAAYNAGPGRPAAVDQLSAATRAARPPIRSTSSSASRSPETRNYVMRILEATHGLPRPAERRRASPLNLAGDLKRGGYSYAGSPNAPIGGLPPIGGATA